MRYPNFSLERKLFQQGYQNIVGIDEVGRGALAGPIVAVAATITSNFQLPTFKKISNPKYQISKKLKIKDSKLLSEKLRESMFEELSKKVTWSIGIVTHREIDKFGITRANILVIKRALRNLEIGPDYLLLDRVNGFKHKLPFELITKGDRKVLSISIASILAKVTRDRMMREYHLKYPDYHFDRHKGYGTKLHQRCLKKHGICRIHRLSYAPVRMVYNNDQ